MTTALAIDSDSNDVYGNSATLRRSYKETTPWLWHFEWTNASGEIIQQADIQVYQMIECLRLSGMVVTSK